MHRAEMRDAWQSWITDAMTQCLRETAFNGAPPRTQKFHGSQQKLQNSMSM
jgi:hypothetical protein